MNSSMRKIATIEVSRDVTLVKDVLRQSRETTIAVLNTRNGGAGDRMTKSMRLVFVDGGQSIRAVSQTEAVSVVDTREAGPADRA